jgi:hypothetical protein
VITKAAEGAAEKLVDRMARLGLASRGLVYLLIAWIAVRIAFHRGNGQQADRQGALHEFAHNAAGKVLLVVMAIGFVGYAGWRLIEAAGCARRADGVDDWVRAGASAARGVLYAFFAGSTFLTALSGSGGAGSDSTSEKATGGLLGEPGGRWLVIVAGVGFVIAGLALAVRGILRKFERGLDTRRMSAGFERGAAALGVVGQTARGVVFGVVGVFLVEAAASFDPQKARGLDGALRTLARGGWGQPLLLVVALGLAAFGLYSLVEARFRKA